MRSSGYVLLITALVLLFLGVLVLPYSLLARLNAERGLTSSSSLQALYLAEAGAQEAIARLDVNPNNPSAGSVVYVCQGTGTTCGPASPDYVGCYTYATAQPADCTAPSLSGGTSVNLWALGKTKDGTIRWVRFTYRTTDQTILSWEVLP
ncbi:hypothetical protein [Thermus igniterrae]|jgi:hypothetical protein|uniref:hypothetical protein n=1 Tax=Thermus igniterrae TaxID=88189 RepID=UPI00039DE960|nr:hypothetical protein [Thermus igniterrae]